MLTTTLNRIRTHGPCKDGWEKLLAGLGKTAPDDEPLPFSRIVEINGIDDALWCCRAEPRYDREWRLFAVWCARQVQHLMTDPRSVAAIDVAERYAWGEATDKELAAAWDAAWMAAWTAQATAAQATAAQATAAQATAARAAAWTVAWTVARVAWAAEAAGAAARAVVREAAHDAQRVEFLRVVNEEKTDG